jgi:2,4-dienoyl-CoA reductase (NADPH2)
LIAAPGTTLASAIPQESLGPLLARLGRGGTEYRICSLLDEIGAGTASLMNVSSGLTERVDCDLVVIQTGRRSVAEATERFRGAGMIVETVGDCVAPRRLSHAMYEAQKVGRSI